MRNLEKRADGCVYPVTVLSYNRHKADLYRITAPLTHDMYFKTSHDFTQVMSQAQKIHRKLLNWEGHLPPQLKPSSYVNSTADIERNDTMRIFALQAFTLQAAYENMQLLLHRPFLLLASSSSASSRDLGAMDKSEFIHVSRTQCWISAMRMTDVHVIPNIITVLESATPYTQWVSYAFNGGVMLATLALSNIASNQTALCKEALARLIKALQSGASKLAMCEQVCQILTRLMHLIAAEEVKSMLADHGEGVVHEDLSIPEYGSTQLDNLTMSSHADPIPSGSISPNDSQSPSLVGCEPTLGPLNDEFGFEDIGHSWLWNDSYSLL